MNQPLRTQLEVENEQEMSIRDYLEKKYREIFNPQQMSELFTAAKSDRATWDVECEIGVQILTNEFEPSVLEATDPEANEVSKQSLQTRYVKLGQIKRNLMHNVYENMFSAIDVTLKNEEKEKPKNLELLQHETNYAIDKEKALRKCDEILICRKFMGYGVGRQTWDKYSLGYDSKWITGIPVFEPIDPRRVWFRARRKDLSDKDLVFHTERYSTELLKQMFPEFAKQLSDTFATDTKANDKYINYRHGYVDLVTIEQKYSFMVDEIPIINEIEGEVKYFLKEEYYDYLQNRFIKGSEPESGIELEVMNRTKDDRDDIVFPQGITAGAMERRREDYWFQTIVVWDDFNKILQKPTNIGKRSSYMILPGNWHPDRIYPKSEAFEHSDLCSIRMIMLTTMLLNTIRIHKPIPVTVDGALANETWFLQNYAKTNVRARVRREWVEQGHDPRQAVFWLKAPETGQMQVLFNNIIENALEENQNAQKVARGFSDSPDESGRAIALKQEAAGTGGRGDFLTLVEFLTETSEKLANDLAEKRIYQHEIEGLDGMETVNGTDQIGNMVPETDITQLADTFFVEVDVDPNAEYQKFLKEQKMKALHDEGSIAYEDYMKNLDLPNVEELIRNNIQEKQNLQIAEYINQNPELKQALIQFMQEHPEAQDKSLQESRTPEVEQRKIPEAGFGDVEK